LRALAAGARTEQQLIEAMNLADDAARAGALLAGLVDDGLAVRDGGSFRLP
jgi:hypothetical protein